MKKGKRKVRDGEVKEKVKKLSSYRLYSKERRSRLLTLNQLMGREP